MNKRLNLKKLIDNFVVYAQEKKIHLYNEAGLQFELAFYLKEKLEKKTYKIQLERNIGDVTNVDSTKFIKNEMDIFIQKKKTGEKYCIELKLPNKGAYPRRMSQAFKDVKFLEELNHLAKFSGGLLFFTTPLKPFWSGKHNGKGVYNCFRKAHMFEKLNSDEIPNFIKNKNVFEIKGCYSFKWETFMKEYRYFTVVI